MSFTPSLTLSTTLFRSFIYLFKKFRFFWEKSLTDLTD
jgi:hypothetical protein